MEFTSFDFDECIMSNIRKAGFITATPIQEQAILPGLQGNDVLGLAQTGTGKTAAFLLPVIQRIMQGERCVPRALILSPTRELAMQTYKAAQLLGKGTGIRSISVYGGTSTYNQIKALKKDMPELIIACPGRLLDLYERKAINIKTIDMLVLDEADEMLDMGFLPSIKKILEIIPQKHQTMLFSATLPDAIQVLAKQLLRNPVRIEIGHSKPVTTVRHFVLHVCQEKKYELLKTVLASEVKESQGQTLVFTKTKYRARKLAEELARDGHSTASLQGNLSQIQRDKAMEKFRTGKVTVMVATDIAARGIDISRITHVINYDMPDTPEAYTHRVGRTGRMMRAGYALSFVTAADRRIQWTIEKIIGKPLEVHSASTALAPNNYAAVPNNYAAKKSEYTEKLERTTGEQKSGSKKRYTSNYKNNTFVLSKKNRNSGKKSAKRNRYESDIHTTISSQQHEYAQSQAAQKKQSTATA